MRCLYPDLLPYGAPTYWDRGYFDAKIAAAAHKARLAVSGTLPDTVSQVLADASEALRSEAVRYCAAFGNPVELDRDTIRAGVS